MNKIQAEPVGRKILQVGDEFHVSDRPIMLRLSPEFDGTRIVSRDETLTVTPWMAGEGREPWFNLIADPEAQIAAWTRIKFEVGPATRPAWTPGDAVWEVERYRALTACWAISDPQERAAALAEVHTRFDVPRKAMTTRG